METPLCQKNPNDLTDDDCRELIAMANCSTGVHYMNYELFREAWKRQDEGKLDA
jgi:hypothetical protein